MKHQPIATNPIITLMELNRNKLYASHKCAVTPTMLLELDTIIRCNMHKSVLKKHSSTIFDMNECRFISHNSIYSHYLSRPSISASIKENTDMLHKLIHPDDLHFSYDTEIRMYYFIKNLPADQQKDFELIFSRRLQEKDGIYRSYVHAIRIFQCDDEGTPWLLKIYTVRIPDVILPAFRLFHPFKDSYTEEHCYSKELLNLNLGDREMEVLNCYVQGKVLSDIVHELNISASTVKTNYGNINRKLGVDTIQKSGLIAGFIGLVQTTDLAGMFMCKDNLRA